MGAFHVWLWTFTATEGWAWGKAAGGLTDHRAESPWDDFACRPSHADKRRAWKREILGNQILAAVRGGADEREILANAERLLNLAA